MRLAVNRTGFTGLHGGLFCILTLLTQVGGIAWLAALLFRRRILAFGLVYALLSGAAMVAAPYFGRTALPCTGNGALQVNSTLYCVLNRHYVTPELKSVLLDLAQNVSAAHPGTVTGVLDAGFPFWNGMPLLPHLSHDDGRKADIAFYYQDETGYLPGRTRSPLGYFAFEAGPTQCVKQWPTLRWDMGWIQGLFARLTPEPERMTTALRLLEQDARVGKVLIEPHLAERFGVRGGKLRFQGCKAARHDDHIHIQL